MRAQLFTLLCISQSQYFLTQELQSKHIKDGVIKYLDYDSKSMLQQMNIQKKLEGWPQILQDKCQNNELTDVAAINEPYFEDPNLTKKEVYVYAGFL